MAVGTPRIALIKFGQESRQGGRIGNHLGDASHLLAPNVVKVQNYESTLTAIDAAHSSFGICERAKQSTVSSLSLNGLL